MKHGLRLRLSGIKGKILIPTVTILLLVSAVSGVASSYMNYASTRDSLEQTLTEAAELAAARVQAELDGYRKLAAELAGNNEIARPIPTTDVGEAAATAVVAEGLEKARQRHGFQLAGRIKADGTDLQTKESLADKEYYQQVKASGKPYISDPVRNGDGTMTCYIAAPIQNNGAFDGAIYFGIDGMFLSDITTSINIGQGNSAILDKNGSTIGYADLQTVLDAYNTQQEVKKDPKLEKLAAIERDMVAGNRGFGDYSYDGVNKYMAYAPIPTSNGWSIDVSVTQKEFMSGTFTSIWTIIVITIVSLLIAAAVMFRVSSTIASPIQKCVERIQLLAKGDLHSPVPRVATHDETGVLASSTEEMTLGLSGLVQDVIYVLEELAHGNLTINTDKTYQGDFAPIHGAVVEIVESLNNALSQIEISADQVAGGSDQVASGSQALSQGATQQASSIEELSATISEISAQIQENAENAQKASAESTNSGEQIQRSNQQMEQMMKAMEEINRKSGEINKIIKTIDDIAFQTNILALNAAVEAARAGVSGKGFAVVADEVRNLAGKSAEAAQTTTELIEDTVKAVENGSRIAAETADSMLKVVEISKEVTALVDQIARQSEQQAVSIQQVNQGVDQIASVVQNNSATSEESAAASEELSGQAQMMKDLVGRFQLKKTSESIL